MPTQSFDAHVRSEPHASVIDLSGDINAQAENTLHSAYTNAEQEGVHSILLNFSRVDYINSTGIALIVSLLSRARKSGRSLLACGLSDHYIEIFKITRLVDFIALFPDEASALAKSASSD